MQNLKALSLGFVVTVALALSSVGFAQSTTQQDPPKAKESCCAMGSCCKGDACKMQHHESKDHAAKAECCKDDCCKGGTCAMKDHGSGNQAATKGCCGDSCAMKHEANHESKNGVTAKDGCCCCGGDSCNMKEHKEKKG